MIRTERNKHRFIFIDGVYQSFFIPKIIVKQIFVTGTPLILNEILWSLGTTMINQSYSTKGLIVVAATNITSTVWNLFCVIMTAMGSAVSIIVGQLLGAGKIDEAKDTDTKLIFFTVILHMLIGLAIILSAPYIPMIYHAEEAVSELTTRLLVVAGAALPLHAFVHVTYFTLRSGGKTMITFLFDCVYTWVISFPLAFTLCRWSELSIVAIYFCVQFADGLKVLIGLKLLHSGVWAKRIITDEVS